MKKIVKTLIVASAFCTALSFSESTIAFELKGVDLDDAKSTVNVKGCRPKKTPSPTRSMFSCDTTFGGRPAEISYMFYEDKIVSLHVTVKSGSLAPVKEALDEKYGLSSQSNQYPDSWNWKNNKNQALVIEKKGNGYHVLAVSWDVHKAMETEEKSRAKKDL